MATWSNKQTNKHKIKMRILGGAIKRKRFKASKGKTSPSHNCHTHCVLHTLYLYYLLSIARDSDYSNSIFYRCDIKTVKSTYSENLPKAICKTIPVMSPSGLDLWRTEQPSPNAQLNLNASYVAGPFCAAIYQICRMPKQIYICV